MMTAWLTSDKDDRLGRESCHRADAAACKHVVAFVCSHVGNGLLEAEVKINVFMWATNKTSWEQDY